VRLVALAGVRGGPGRNENHLSPRGGNATSRNQRGMSTGSIGSNGDLSHLDFGSPPPRGASGLDAKFRWTRSGRDRRVAARSPSEGESSREDTSCEEGLGFRMTRYPLANSDRLCPSSRASTSDTETRSPRLSTKPLPAKPPGAKTPPFNLVDASFDPSLGPKCRARVGRPEGIRSPHASDDDHEALPPGLFRPAEANALSVLDA
jgi:hypothetical protein